MELHDFHPGPAGEGAWAALIEGEGMWVLLVQDSAGAQHRVRVPAPLTPAEREDTLALAARLLDPSPSLGEPLVLPPEPEPTPEPEPEPALRPAVVEAEEAAPLLAGMGIPDPVVGPRSLEGSEVATLRRIPLASPPEKRGSVRVGSAFGFRPDQELSAGLSLDASWGLPRAQLGVGLWWAAPSAWPLVPDGRSGGVATMGGVRLEPWRGSRVALQAGAERRNWTLAGEPVLTHWLPTSRAMIGWALPLGRITVEPAVELRVDLARTELQLGDRALGSIAPWQAGLNLGISWSGDPKGRVEAQSP